MHEDLAAGRIAPPPPRHGMKWRQLLQAARGGWRLCEQTGQTLSTIFLIPRPWIGIILWAAIAYSNIRHAGFGLFGLAVGDVLVRALGIHDRPLLGGGVRANALLTGIGVAWLTTASTSPLSVELGVAALAATLAALFTAALMRALADTILPPLVLGFCTVTGSLFVLFPVWMATAVSVTPGWSAPVDLVSLLQSFICSLGSLLFSSTLSVGIIVATALLLWSRVMFITGAVGWLAGVLTAIGFHYLFVPFYWEPTSDSFFIAGMALGASFFLPSWTSLILAATGGCTAAVFAVILQHIAPNLAFLPVSAALTIWLGLSAFTLTRNKRVFIRNEWRDVPPEEAWLRRSNWSQRFGWGEPLLVVPVACSVQITQGFNGSLSHVGLWRHALDFQCPVMTDASGGVLSIWDAAVIVPASGIVESVRNDIADNPLGICNYADNWGNHVLIRMDQGNWALLAHLRQHSIVVVPGMRVQIGTYLAAVGNSGRSPVPHLHLHVQGAPWLGAATVPFRLLNYQAAINPENPLDHWYEAAVPAESTTLAAAVPNPAVHAVLASSAPGTALWAVDAKGRIPRAFRPAQRYATAIQIVTQLSAEGQHSLKTAANGMLVLSLDPDAWRIQKLHGPASPFLELLALAVPAIPYAARPGLVWQEPAPISPRTTHALAFSLWPYMNCSLTDVRCVCLSEPGPQGQLLTIECSPIRQEPFLPLKLIAQFDRLRGPIRIEATFKDGMIVYSQLSFEPGLPFGDGSAQATALWRRYGSILGGSRRARPRHPI
jgi:Urea transporter/Peptidase family M23